MELNENELKSVLGGANPNVISKDKFLKEDEISEDQLGNVMAGIHDKELANDIALENESFYRQEMIQRLKEEKEKIISESGSKSK